MLRPWDLKLDVSASSQTPAYMQVVYAIIEEIRRGRLQPGTALPGSRVLADALGVNRKTVTSAYEELSAQGWIRSESTRGTFVCPGLPTMRPGSKPPKPSRHATFGATSSFGIEPGDFEVPLVTHSRGVLTFDDGTPDPRLIPFDIVARAFRRALARTARRRELGYGDPRGIFALRQAISTMLNLERGLATTANNILLTRGSQMALYLSARVLVRPGDIVVVDQLTYPPARAAFENAGATIRTVRVDRGGTRVDDLQSLLAANEIRAIYLTPHHHFPTTVSLPPDRRLRLVDLAQKHNFAIVEDDYDHEFHFTHQPRLPLASVASKQVVYIGSLSKILTPSLRIGYLAASADLVDAAAREIVLIDRQGDPVVETAVAELIDDGEVRRHARKAHAVYDERRDVFADCLREAFGDAISFTTPDGGLAIWVEFKTDVPLASLHAAAREHGVEFMPNDRFGNSGKPCRGLRLGYASLEPQEIRMAVQRLAAAYRSVTVDRRVEVH